MSRHTLARPPVFACLLIALSGSLAAQTTWYVDIQAVPPGLGTQAQPYTSIQYAIVQPATVNGDTILVAPGQYVENVNTLNKSLILRSSGGPLVTTILPAQSDSTVILEKNSHLEGFTITSQAAIAPSAGVDAGGASEIRRCIVRDFSNGNGIVGGLNAFVYNSTITGNLIGVRSIVLGGPVALDGCIVGFNLYQDIHEDKGSGGVPTSFSLVGHHDPGFWDYEKRDLRLRPGSPAINAGNPSAPPDPDGSVVDAGALTYDPTYAPGPSTYCTGKLNSQGCVPAIGAVGSASATSPNPFLITASNKIPQTPGLLFFGFGDGAMPFQGAWYCVEPPTPRVGGQMSTGSGPCSGTFSFDMRAYIQSGVYPALVPGALVYCQWWSRDLADPAGFGTGLTNALYFGIAP